MSALWDWLRSEEVRPEPPNCADRLKLLVDDQGRFFDQVRSSLRNLKNAEERSAGGLAFMEALRGPRSWPHAIGESLVIGNAEVIKGNKTGKEKLPDMGAAVGKSRMEIKCAGDYAQSLRGLRKNLDDFFCDPKKPDSAPVWLIEGIDPGFRVRLDSLAFLAEQVLTLVESIFNLWGQGKEPGVFDDTTQLAFGGDQRSCYCAAGTLRWEIAARASLLTDADVIRFPVAAAKIDGKESQGTVLDFEVSILHNAPFAICEHPLQRGTHDPDFRQAVEDAWKAAYHLMKGKTDRSSMAMWRAIRRGDELGRLLSGKSAGGAFALALANAVLKRKYDPRVVVIASVAENGEIQPLVQTESADVNVTLRAKVGAILKHPEIDTIATVEPHYSFILGMESYKSQNGVRVVNIADYDPIEIKETPVAGTAALS